MPRKLADDSGAVAIIVAGLLLAIVGLTALVVDLGYWFDAKRQLQSAADAAALAGCRDLLLGEDEAAITSTIIEYAAYNAVPPADGAQVDWDMTEIDFADEAVKVTVYKDTPTFFGRVLGFGSGVQRAQARATCAYLSGARPMPWALPILQVTRTEATDGDGPWVPLSEGSTAWTGHLASSSSGPVTIRAYNGQTVDPAYPDGYYEEMDGIARIVRLSADSIVEDVRLDQATFTSGSGQDAVLRVELTEPLGDGLEIVATLGKSEYVMTEASDTLYRVSLPVPSTIELWEAFGVDVAVMEEGKPVEEIEPAATLVVRRSTYPISDVRVHPTVLTASDTRRPHVSVSFNDYQYGKVYELKVVGGQGEVGNYMAIDFSTIRHGAVYRTSQLPPEYPDLPSSTSEYYAYIAGTSDADFILHIGDTVWTEPGNMSGPQTINALNTRFTDNLSFDEWVAAGKPASSRLVVVPITEKISRTTGTSPLYVVTFANFYIEDVFTKQGDAVVRGRFVEYTQPPGSVTSDPPPGFGIKVVRLTSEDLDF